MDSIVLEVPDSLIVVITTRSKLLSMASVTGTLYLEKKGLEAQIDVILTHMVAGWSMVCTTQDKHVRVFATIRVYENHLHAPPPPRTDCRATSTQKRSFAGTVSPSVR